MSEQNNQNTSRPNKVTVHDIALVGLMAAAVFVATYIRIEFPTPVGKGMVHLGNIVCLLAGLLFGPVRGGLSAGIGSFFFDIFGGWASSAPFTLVFKFMMGYLCGVISWGGDAKGTNTRKNIIGAITGMYGYVVLYLAKSFITALMLGNVWQTALADVGIKATTSFLNGTLAIVLSCLLAPVLRRALSRAGVYKKFVK